MKFYIETSSWSYEEKTPCEGAVLVNPDRAEWERPLYCIEIETLEELIALKDRVNHSIILAGPVSEPAGTLYSLEIYDTYRE